MERIINVTPHSITFRRGDGTDFMVHPSGSLCGASAVESVMEYTRFDGVSLVRTVFIPTEEGNQEVEDLMEKFPEYIIVGSIISAQAYPGRVFGMTPSPGFERVPPAEKKMNPYKFITY